MLKEVVQKFEQTLSLRPVTDGVKATIWTEFLKETGVWICLLYTSDAADE